MADYLVLEEDGTSHLELEESTDDLVLEDGTFVYTTTGYGAAGLTSTAGTGGTHVATSRASYKGGVFTVPGSTGNFSVTGVGFEPQVVLFYGSNETTEDSVVTGSASALMRGTMVLDDETTTIISWCSSAVPHDSMRWEQKPIVCALDGGSGTDYQADAVSMDSDGFTVNFTTVPGATRKVHYVCIGRMSNSFAKIIGSNFGGLSASVDVGWRVQTGLAIGGLDDTVQDVAGANAEASTWGHMLSWGGKSFQTDNQLAHNSMFLRAVDTPFSDQDDLEIHRFEGSTSYIGRGSHFIGPFMNQGPYQMTLSGSGLTTVDMSLNPDNQVHFTGLPVQSNTGNVNPADAVDGTVDIVSENPDVQIPQLLLFYSCLGRESSSDAWPSSFSFGFWTEEHSYCVGGNGNDGSFFQSEQYAWIDTLTASGAHAGTVTSNAPSEVGFTLTTEVADVTGGSRMVWHMFGPPFLDVAWIPQITRWMVGP